MIEGCFDIVIFKRKISIRLILAFCIFNIFRALSYSVLFLELIYLCILQAELIHSFEYFTYFVFGSVLVCLITN